MLYGGVPQLPVYVDNETEIRDGQENHPIEYLDEIRDRQQAIRQFVSRKLECVQEKQKRAYDERFKTAKSKPLLPGDNVMSVDNTSSGLAARYNKPFMIIETDGSNCQIRSLLNGK